MNEFTVTPVWAPSGVRVVTIVTPVVTASIVAAVLSPVVRQLAHHMPRAAAAALVFVALIHSLGTGITALASVAVFLSFTLLSSEGTGTAVAMAVIVLLANGALQHLIQPIAFGTALGIHPLAVLIVTIAGGCLFGGIGLVLAAPLTSAAVHISADLARARAPDPEVAATPAPG